ncbi:hypothetical protein MALU111345_16845 [Marinicrinis lubricantis]
MMECEKPRMVLGFEMLIFLWCTHTDGGEDAVIHAKICRSDERD